MKTEPNDPITTTNYRQTGDNEFRVDTEKDVLQGVWISTKHGLTKREYFAAMAMNACISNSRDEAVTANQVAKWSVKTADALIAALNEKEG